MLKLCFFCFWAAIELNVSIPFMSSFNKSEAAIFHICLGRTFYFLKIITKHFLFDLCIDLIPMKVQVDTKQSLARGLLSLIV